MPRSAPTLYRCFHDRRMTDIRGPAARACPGSTYEGVDAMGRGRQKAKQQKVARQLKYYSPDTDYSALQRELTGSTGSHISAVDDTLENDDEDESADEREAVAVQAAGPHREDDVTRPDAVRPQQVVRLDDAHGRPGEVVLVR